MLGASLTYDTPFLPAIKSCPNTGCADGTSQHLECKFAPLATHRLRLGGMVGRHRFWSSQAMQDTIAPPEHTADLLSRSLARGFVWCASRISVHAILPEHPKWLRWLWPFRGGGRAALTRCYRGDDGLRQDMKLKELTYTHAALNIPAAYSEGHERYWNRLANPGNWFTGQQRVDMAKEVRQALDCKLCADRKLAVSPAMAQGEA